MTITTSHAQLRAVPARLALALLALGCSTSLSAQTTSTLSPVLVTDTSPSLTAPSATLAREALQQMAGAVAVVDEGAWRDTQATTVKDMFDYTPGVFAQPKWGEDTRLSIRGSGLSRYYHLRGIALYQDGVPLNNADGSSDFQWIDPTAYRYAEVYKGANALQYGAGTLGGAVNFVTPTGRDAPRAQARLDVGSFGWRRVQASTGLAEGAVDGFLTASWQRQDGFREQSAGHSLRASGNLGWQLTDHIETRFYLTGVRVRQEIPGTVSREQALDDPAAAAAYNVMNNWRRDINGVRVANRTAITSGDTTYEFGGWHAHTKLDHPIYQVLVNRYKDYGAYARLLNTSTLVGRDNRVTLGVTWSGGTIDAANYENAGGQRAALLSRTDDDARNLTLYAENALTVTHGLTVLLGAQFQRAERKRIDRYNGGAVLTRDGKRTYDLFNPRLGLLWEVAPDWQVYGNVSRSGEAPTFGDMNFSSTASLDQLSAQRATTVEVGTRGERGDLTWDVSLYHARLKDELQCVSVPWNICNDIVNLDRTQHQGVEAGLEWTAARGLLAPDGTDYLTVHGAYTFSDFRFRDDPQWGNNQIPGAPRHYLRAEVLYHHPAGFYLGPNVEWVPQAFYADNANTLKTASYALLGLRAGWSQGPYRVFIEGRNLTNRRYIASASVTDRASPDAELFEPGSGRAVFVGLQLTY